MIIVSDCIVNTFVIVTGNGKNILFTSLLRNNLGFISFVRCVHAYGPYRCSLLYMSLAGMNVVITKGGHC